ncbi:hypothetical protein D3C73_1139160 [compost metagenome]
MVLSQARRLPVIRCTMNRRQARAAAMALMKLPTIMRGIDSTACSQPYMRPTKYARCITRSSRATALSHISVTSQPPGRKYDG